MTKGDVLVVGGGVMGLCIALELRRRGASVTLLEKAHVGAGASGKSGAILRQHYSNPLTVAMARDGLRAYAAFEEYAGGPSGFRRVGCLIMADARERAALEGNIGLMRDAGCRAELLTPAQIAEVAPMLSVPDGALGAWEPDAGYCEPVTVLHTLKEACRREGVTLRLGAEVARFNTGKGARGPVTGATLEGGEGIAAGAVVLAAGPWTNRLLAPLGLSVPITNTRPTLAFLARPLDLPDHPVVGDLLSGVYFRPDGPNTLIGALDLSGDDVIESPDTYDGSVPNAFLTSCRWRAAERMPALWRGYGRGGYAGIYDCTPDMHPVLGAIPEAPGLYVAAGFSGHGFKLAPVVGRGLAELVTAGRYEALDLSALAPTRYSEDRPVRAAYEYGLLA